MVSPLDLPTSHKQLRSMVAERLRMAILEGRYQPGEWLRQERLAQELGVSQMPVREALKELAAEGLVEHVPYRGVRVVEFSTEDVTDLYAQRSYLEGIAAYSAAQRITPAELAELHSLQARMQQYMSPADLPTYRELNRRFHQVVFSASRREYLIRTLNQLWSTFPTMLWANFFTTALKTLPERDASDLLEHERIIAALECHDAGLAQELVRKHIEAAGMDLVRALQAGQ